MYSSKKEAQEAGEKALSLINEPEGWEIKITQNVGWHMFLFKQGMSLTRCDASGNFMVLLSDSLEDGGGKMFWAQGGQFKDPNEAIRAQLKTADAFLDKVLKVRKTHGKH